MMDGDTLPRLLQQWAGADGGRVALRQKELGVWREISWEAYAERVRAFGDGLLALGLEPGDCVAVLSENRPEWLYVDLASQSIGAITVGIYVTSSQEQVAYIVEHSGSKVIVVEDEEQLDKVIETLDQTSKLEKIIVIDRKGLRDLQHEDVIFFDELLEQGRQFGAEHPVAFPTRLTEGDSSQTALLVYTSGTTGPPKGAMLSHLNLIFTSKALHAANPIYRSDEVLSFLPLCHIAERLMTVVNQLVFGYTVSFAENLDTVPQNLREIGPTVFFAVPRIWEKYHAKILLTMDKADWSKRLVFNGAMKVGVYAAGHPENGHELGRRLAYRAAYFTVFHPLKKRLGLERVRLALSGAAPISPQILRFFRMIGVPMREVYGQTEGSGPTTIHQGDDIRYGTVGKPLPGVDVEIAEDGEILVRGDNVFQGYYRDPEATERTLVDGCLRSGDVGELDEDGFLRITDRKKDLIITAGGKNIAPQNIENRLKFSLYINDAVVIGDRRPFLSALLLIDEENVTHYAQEQRIPFTTYADLAKNEDIFRLLESEVRQVNESLAAVERVRKFVVLDKRLEEEDGEVTPTMKVKRQSISEAYAEVIEGMYRR